MSAVVITTLRGLFPLALDLPLTPCVCVFLCLYPPFVLFHLSLLLFYLHPAALLLCPSVSLFQFLVGMRGKDEAMAIGGHWSPSLDGADPERDPSVLIKTATRCCKALTGIDLSLCTQW